MKIYKLEILDRDMVGAEGDWTYGFYSSRKLAEDTFEKYAESQQELCDKWAKEEGLEESEVFLNRHCSYISEHELDEPWDKE
jgi:hypothetical protein